MKILIRSLLLTNFKGVRSFEAKFHDHENYIFGRNEAGKTTLMDAFLWLFFGKDSSDRKDFEVKTLDENNQPYHKLDHEVTAIINVDGDEVSIRRSLREKWVKKRGNETSEFNGHETTFFWNEAPMKESEYQAKVASIINEGLFKLLTNTLYFNSLKWQERRAVLKNVAGTIDDLEILESISNSISADHVEKIKEAIKKGKNKENFKEYRAEIGAKKKKLKDELIVMPSRIDEANRSLPEVLNYEEINENIITVNADIDSIDGTLQNSSKAYMEHNEEINRLITRRQNINQKQVDLEFTIKNEVKEKKQQRLQKIIDSKAEHRQVSDDLSRLRIDYQTTAARKNQLLEEKESLLTKHSSIDSETLQFKDGEFCCPACKREFEAADIETKKKELTENFNNSKSKRLNEITVRGAAINAEISDLDTKIGNLTANGEALKGKLTAITNRIAELEQENERLSGDEEKQITEAIAASEAYQCNKAEMNVLTEKIDTPYREEDSSALIQRKRELNEQLSELKKKLGTKELREKQLARIDELIDQEATMNQELASFEGIEFSIEKLVKATMDTLEARINGRFKIVRFKMFEEQINGGEIEACTTLINGVPFPDANTASKIQAGLDIINTLSQHYGIQAPVWIDNRESVIKLPETDCQVINLVVSEHDKKLRISSSKNEMAEA